MSVSSLFRIREYCASSFSWAGFHSSVYFFRLSLAIARLSSRAATFSWSCLRIWPPSSLSSPKAFCDLNWFSSNFFSASASLSSSYSASILSASLYYSYSHSYDVRFVTLSSLSSSSLEGFNHQYSLTLNASFLPGRVLESVLWVCYQKPISAHCEYLAWPPQSSLSRSTVGASLSCRLLHQIESD